MNQGLKQRLVGTLVLLALAVILAPVLFNFGEQTVVDSRSQVPPAPDLEPVIFSEPQRPTDIPERDEGELFWPEEVFDPAEARASAEALETTPGSIANEPAPPGGDPVAPAAVPADAWVIQVGTFAEQAGADVLLQKLIGEGYKAYHRSQFRNGTEWHLIFVGPVLSRAEADRQKTAIERQYSLDTLIRRFSP